MIARLDWSDINPEQYNMFCIKVELDNCQFYNYILYYYISPSMVQTVLFSVL